VKLYLNHPVSRQILFFLLSIVLVAACSSSHAQQRSRGGELISPSDGSGKLSDQGQLRTYYLYTPKSYNPNRPMPLVLVFHGSNGTGHSIADVTRFNDLAEKKGFIVVYPDGINHNWRIRRGGFYPKVDDVSFVAALIDHLKQVRNIDSRKIYATGFSKGGILTQNLACDLPNQIAAFASVAGSLPVPLESSCQPQTPVSMLMINGTNDQSVYYEGDPRDQRGALVSIPETIDFWRSQDKCTSPAQAQQLPDPKPRDRFKVNISRYSGCRAGSEVTLMAVVDGGHMWPGGASQDESVKRFNANLGFNASETIWDFFQRHTLP
jgi:polyhydroxybutyrate depolymerase